LIIIVAENYITKWVKIKALWDNVAKRTTKFLYEHIITTFGCLKHLVREHGNHFVNWTIEILNEEFMFYISQLDYLLPRKEWTSPID